MPNEPFYTISKDHTGRASQANDLSILLAERPATDVAKTEAPGLDPTSASTGPEGSRIKSRIRFSPPPEIYLSETSSSEIEGRTTRIPRFFREKENRSRGRARSRGYSPVSPKLRAAQFTDLIDASGPRRPWGRTVSSPSSPLSDSSESDGEASVRSGQGRDTQLLAEDLELVMTRARRMHSAAAQDVPTTRKRRIDTAASSFEKSPKRPALEFQPPMRANINTDVTVDSRALDERISALKTEITILESLRRQQIPQEWRVIYRVHRLKQSDAGSSRDRMEIFHYLDQPRWYGGIVNHEPLAGTEPILDLKSYLDRHSELCFVVFRDYGTEKPDGNHFSAVGEAHPRSPEEGYPLPSMESTLFTYSEMVQAMNHFLKSLPLNNGISFPQEKPWPQELQAPYLAIYHYWDRFISVGDSLPQRVQGPWNMFVDYIKQGFHPEYIQVRHQFQQGLVCPRSLKYLIKPGDILYIPGHAVVEAVQAVSQLHKAAGHATRNVLLADWDGGESDTERPILNLQQRRRHQVSWSIEVTFWSFHISFKREHQTQVLDLSTDIGEKVPIVSLKFYPLRFVSPAIEERLTARGLSFWQCRNRRYVEYSKDAGAHTWSSIKSRYMIDPVTYQRMHGNKVPEEALLASSDLSAHVLQQGQCPDYPFAVLLPRTVQGYNFVEKIWVDLDVDYISDVQWNTQAFENLVTEEQTKDLLEALVKNQLNVEMSTDLISGKGNGLIILLHGGPGTGKTYTAESVADYARKPLYRVTCGDIGTKPVDVEKYLETVLRLGRIWSCVVLLDEADIFLEERTLSDLERNALVSVFLRVLEYYNGILILTSNRVGHFDEAFRSRIQLALHYESLGREQRHQIWSNFIKHLRASDACNMDFDDLVLHINDLSMYEMNGRQIRNAITTARQLAEFKKKNLNYDILKKVIMVTGKFDRYLQGVKQLETMKEGTVDDTIAREAGMR